MRVGLNPYGLTYYLGLQGRGTPRANPDGARPRRLHRASPTSSARRSLEIFEPWLAGDADDAELAALRDRLAGARHDAGRQRRPRHDGRRSTLPSARATAARRDDRSASALTPDPLRRPRRRGRRSGASSTRRIARRARRMGPARRRRGLHARRSRTTRTSPAAELVAFCEANRGVGIIFDTGNTFPVAEAPLDFTRVVAPHVRHVHLKDYRVQFTDEGFRLVRCAIGDGAVPLRRDARRSSPSTSATLTAVLEPGALEARHVRLFTPDWWHGYAPKSAPELAACLRAAQANRLPDDADCRTPWERGDDGELEAYELDMIRRSAANMRALGIMLKEDDDGQGTERQDRLRHRLGPRPRPRHGRAAGRARRRRRDPRPRPDAAGEVRRVRGPRRGRRAASARHGAQGRGRHRQHRRPRRGGEDEGRHRGRARRGRTSSSTAPAATSAPRAASPSPTTPSTSPSRTSRC